MLPLLESILLGILQGATEWLPVSSSGHLVIVQHLFGINPPVLFDVLLHCGTLSALLLFLRKDIWRIVATSSSLNFREDRLPLSIVAGSIPTAAMGFAMHDFFVSLFNVRAVGCALIATGIILLHARERDKKKVGLCDAFLIGIAQGISIIPGISRSGITITSALLRGVERSEAMRFSFLLSIPAVAGAVLFEGYSSSFSDIAFLPSAAGMAASALMGYLSLGFLSGVVRKGKIHYFSVYCFLIGAVALLISFGLP